jgi:ATP-dependent Lon protease
MEKEKIYYINRKVVFPNCTMNVVIPLTEISKNLQTGDKIIAYPIRNIFDIYFFRNKMATYAEILSLTILEKTIKIKIKGLYRITLNRIYNFTEADFLETLEKKTGSEEKTIENLRKKAQELIFLINVEESDKLINLLNYLTDLSQLTDFISNYFIIDFRTRRKLFYEIDIDKRSLLLENIINRLIKKMNTGKRDYYEKKNT